MRKKLSAHPDSVPATSKPHLAWIDTVRLAAFFTLACCHCANPFNWIPAGSPMADQVQFWGNLYGSALRHSVPFFVMMTGALLLPVRTSVRDFYRKRIPRVLWPLLLWGILYSLFPYLLGQAGMGKEVVQSFFPYAGSDFLTQELQVALKHILFLPFSFPSVGLHLWYVYLLIGLYLYMPIFSCWVERASEKEKLGFLLAWGVASALPYCTYFISPEFWGTCAWNDFGMLYYFAGYNGYLLLGHYLRYRTWSGRKLLLFGLPMFAAGYAITYCGRAYLQGLPLCTEQMAELFWTNNSPNVIMMTVPLFMACKAMRVTSPTLRKWLATLPACGFGIYMVHYFFVGYSVIAMRQLGVPLGAQIPAAAVVTLSLSWIFVAFLRRILGGRARWIVG